MLVLCHNVNMSFVQRTVQICIRSYGWKIKAVKWNSLKIKETLGWKNGRKFISSRIQSFGSLKDACGYLGTLLLRTPPSLILFLSIFPLSSTLSWNINVFLRLCVTVCLCVCMCVGVYVGMLVCWCVCVCEILFLCREWIKERERKRKI